MFDATEAAFGSVSYLVNNAAITNEFRMLEACDGAYVERLLRVNTIGPVLTTTEFARRFRGTVGRVVNASSGAARYPVDGLSVSSASKAALEALIFVALSQSLADCSKR